MKKCKSIEKKLTAYLHGELKESELRIVEGHMTDCESCRAALDAERLTLDMLGAALEAAPAPEQLKPWWKLRTRERVHHTLSDYWLSPRLRAALSTGAIFSLLFVISLNVYFVRVMQDKNEPDPVPVSLMKPKPMELKKLRVPLSMKSTRMEEKRFRSGDRSAEFQTEQYHHIVENNFKEAMQNPLSTFSIDVDRAAYANIRRFLNDNQLPPADAVRIEEMLNYFDYDYPRPKGDDPFVVALDLADCPWNPAHQLAMVGLQGLDIETKDLPPNNLVFLLDVSGSMNAPNKLPLLKSALHLLVDQLRPEDRVSIVVYAGAAGLVLEPTANHEKIMEAIERLEAGGSTAGGAGIELAYRIAHENRIEEGNNRVILATDGDFNVGPSSDGALTRLIEKKRETGIFLTVLGLGTGNYKDSKMEQLADKGNGNYAYIDDILEARKVLVKEMGGTLLTIAKDVKVQVEFNPAIVKAYRLIGYENRMLAKEDFADDRKDAGDLGAGHTVTALYELIPAISDEQVPVADDLKYQINQLVSSDEVMTIKLRYKHPKGDRSRLLVQSVKAVEVDRYTPSENLRFASSVAEFGLLLRDSEYKGNANYQEVIRRAKASKGADTEGYRAEFIRMVEKAELLSAEKPR